jgi:hypothetical protein
MAYNAELRGICNYYNIASNFYKLHYFSYLMEYSCLKTLAAKHKSCIRKIREQFKDGRGNWCIPYKNKRGQQQMYLAKYTNCRSTSVNDKITATPTILKNNINSFERLINAKICELCGSENSKQYEIHHVNKVKNLKGKQQWERVMIAKKRKTMVVCYDCHLKIHGRTNKKSFD